MVTGSALRLLRAGLALAGTGLAALAYGADPAGGSTGQISAAHAGPVQRLDQGEALRASQAAVGNRLSDHRLLDGAGGSVRLSDLRGKPLLISFVYTGCFQVCPTTTRTLKRAVEAAMGAFGTDAFNVVTVGFNLPFDSPEAMRAFGRQQGIHLPNWHFLSPDADTLHALAQEVGFQFVPVTGGFDHLTQVTVVDLRGVVTAQVYGDGFALSALTEALELALRGERAAPVDAIGLIERLRILCTYYDPVSGQYRFKYAIVLELAGGVTGIVVLALFVFQRRRAAALR